MCEIWEKGLCLGCEGLSLEYEMLIDRLKLDCETYKKEMKRLEKEGN